MCRFHKYQLLSSNFRDVKNIRAEFVTRFFLGQSRRTGLLHKRASSTRSFSSAILWILSQVIMASLFTARRKPKRVASSEGTPSEQTVQDGKSELFLPYS